MSSTMPGELDALRLHNRIALPPRSRIPRARYVPVPPQFAEGGSASAMEV